jgi:hypothetical protein
VGAVENLFVRATPFEPASFRDIFDLLVGLTAPRLIVFRCASANGIAHTASSKSR